MYSRYSMGRLLAAVMLLLVAGSLGCGSQGESSNAPTASIDSDNGDSTDGPDAQSLSGPVRLTPRDEGSDSPARQPVNLYPIVLIQTTLGDIKVKLNAEKAPITVENFLDNYTEHRIYENTIFHYVEQGFVISAGGYTSDLQPIETRGEILNEADNGLHNLRGTIAMARHPQFAKSATSQFFFNLADLPALDHRADQLDENYDENFGYCVFGEVVEGMDVLDRIAAVDVHDTDVFPNVPLEPIVIKSVRRLE